MKKPKLIFKINRNNTAKIYVGGKWQKGVANLSIDAKPFCHNVKLAQTIHDSNGNLIFKDNEIVHTEKCFYFGAK